MEFRQLRFLGPVLARAEQNEAKAKGILQGKAEKAAFTDKARGKEKVAIKDQIPLEFNGRDYVTFLLHIDAEIEHGLMLQYLYGAYSLGGPQVPKPYQDLVRQWQEVILGVAKEEMGHFVSVQNVLRLIGGPLNFGRQDYPWDTPFYPFPFKLEPLTLNSLAKYLFAESPEGWIDSDDPVAVDAKARLELEVEHPVRVGALFEVLLELIKDPEVIPDSAFEASSYPFQAKFAEWGRNYTGGQRGNATGGNPQGAPSVLVEAGASRDDAYNALSEIAEQGEAKTAADDNDLPSHFMRFHKIYAEWMALNAKSDGTWSPSRDVATNPYVDDSSSDPDSSPSEGQENDEEREAITDPETQLWAHLSNLRYRMLLNFLTHSFLLEDGYTGSGAHAPRGAIINSTFGEMYNLRSIANVLIQQPMGPGSDKFAAPPFQIPYTLDLPSSEANRWAVHRDCLEASERIISKLMRRASDRNRQYLHALREADGLLFKMISQMQSTAV